MAVVIPVGLGQGAGDRLTVASPDRAQEWKAATGVIADHPLTGTSPGNYRLWWTDDAGQVWSVGFAHNEYLQLAGELGLVGAAVAAFAAALTARWMWSARRRFGTWAGPVAGLAAFATHSAFDFVWHIPVLVAMAAVLVGLAGPGTTPTEGNR